MDFKATSGNWIYAYSSSGGPKNTDDTSAQISQHSDQGVFSWDFAQAKGGSSVNPLVSTTSTGTSGGGGTGTTNCKPRPSTSSSSASSAAATSSSASTNGGSDDDDDGDRGPGNGNGGGNGRPNGGNGGGNNKRQQDDQDLPYCDELPNNGGSTNSGSSAGFTPISSSGGSNRRQMLIAHGVLASLAFVIFFPIGGIAIRLVSMPGIAWLHGGFQILGYALYVAAAGLGIYLACGMNLLNNHHAIIGMVLLAVLFFQPMLGWVHHLYFKKFQCRTVWSHAHIWVGRLAITLGIINGGLGLRLAQSYNMSSRSGQIAYGVIAALVWLAWVGAMVIGESRRKKRVPARARAPKLADERANSDQSNVGMTGHYDPKRQ
jgi:hypothetical protein